MPSALNIANGIGTNNIELLQIQDPRYDRSVCFRYSNSAVLIIVYIRHANRRYNIDVKLSSRYCTCCIKTKRITILFAYQFNACLKHSLNNAGKRTI